MVGSVTLLGPPWFLMLTWWCTRCKGRTVFCETSTPWFFCLFRHSKWKDALRPETGITHNCVHHSCYTTINPISISFSAVPLEIQQRHPHFRLCALSLNTLTFPKRLCLKKAVKHHGPTSTTFQASCQIKFWMVIFIFPLLRHCPSKYQTADFPPKQWKCSQTSLVQVKPSAGPMMTAEALVLCLAVHIVQEGTSGCSGDIGHPLACDLCPLAARHTTVYGAVSTARSSGRELIKFTGEWKAAYIDMKHFQNLERREEKKLFFS